MVMVEKFKNIAVIFEFSTGPSRDHVGSGSDHTGPSRDISSGYVLVVFFNLEQFWSWSGHVWS